MRLVRRARRHPRPEPRGRKRVGWFDGFRERHDCARDSIAPSRLFPGRCSLRRQPMISLPRRKRDAATGLRDDGACGHQRAGVDPGAGRGIGGGACDLGLQPRPDSRRADRQRCRLATRFPMGDGLVCLTDPGRQPINVLTSMFLHGSWMHLHRQHVVPLAVRQQHRRLDDAPPVRRVLSALRPGGGAAAGARRARSAIPMVGASGAISGVMGAYLVLFPRVRVFTLLPLGFFFTTVALPAWAMLIYWAVLQIFGGLSSVWATRAAASRSGPTSAGSSPASSSSSCSNVPIAWSPTSRTTGNRSEGSGGEGYRAAALTCCARACAGFSVRAASACVRASAARPTLISQ